MTATVTAPPGITDGSHASAPPDWSLVPFDVGCARCGHDLHGLTEPKCPACFLEFKWNLAVPIGELACTSCGYHLYGLSKPRCPECGLGFDWNEVLDVWRRQQKDLLEYRWRDGIVRSTLSTWRRSLRPGTLWRSIDLHDPPNTKPLILLVVVTVMAAALLWNTFIVVEDWRWMKSMRGLYASPTVAEIPLMWLGNLTTRHFWGMALLIASWCSLTLPALLILRQSMTRCRIRNAHVIRVWAYANAGLLLPYTAVCAATLLGLEMSGARGYSWIPLMAFAYVVFAGWSIRQGYRHYLRMDHSLGVAIAAQLIALLAASLLHRAAIEALRPLFAW